MLTGEETLAGLVRERGWPTPRCARWRVAPASGRGGHGTLTSESQAGDRVAAPVLLQAGEVAGPHQLAAQHGSAGPHRASARLRSSRAKEERAVASAAPPRTSPDAWERQRRGHRTPAGWTLPSRHDADPPAGGGRDGPALRRALAGALVPSAGPRPRQEWKRR